MHKRRVRTVLSVSGRLHIRPSARVVLEAVSDVQAALWGFERLAPFNAYSVGSLVPQGFERYARILHPGWRIEERRRLPVRWSEMASCTESQSHALMQWKKIAAPNMGDAEVLAPDEGTIPVAVSSHLANILSLRTDCRCWLGVWGGYGGGYSEHVPQPTKSVDTGARHWDLFRAPLRAAFRPFFCWGYTANLIWSDDRGWWLTTDIDLNSSYIGGNASLIEALLGSDELETWPASPDDDITWDSDKINFRSFSSATADSGSQGECRMPWSWRRTILSALPFVSDTETGSTLFAQNDRGRWWRRRKRR